MVICRVQEIAAMRPAPCLMEGMREIEGHYSGGTIVIERHEPAKYLWVTVRGVRLELCEACCAQWRKTGGPDVAPVRITLLDQEE